MATSLHASVVLHEQSFPCSALLCLMQNGDCPHPLGRTPAWQQDVTAVGRGFGFSWVLSKDGRRREKGLSSPRRGCSVPTASQHFGVPSISGCPGLAGGKNWAKIPSFSLIPCYPPGQRGLQTEV